MSIFPTRVLLATDGSEEAELALRTAVDLANGTGSELHVLTVGREYHPGYDIPSTAANSKKRSGDSNARLEGYSTGRRGRSRRPGGR